MYIMIAQRSTIIGMIANKETILPDPSNMDPGGCVVAEVPAWEIGGDRDSVSRWTTGVIFLVSFTESTGFALPPRRVVLSADCNCSIR